MHLSCCTALAACRDATYLRIMKAEPWLPSHLSSPARDLVLMLLRKDPQQRPAVKHLQQHAWLRQSQPVRAAAAPEMQCMHVRAGMECRGGKK